MKSRDSVSPRSFKVSEEKSQPCHARKCVWSVKSVILLSGVGFLFCVQNKATEQVHEVDYSRKLEQSVVRKDTVLMYIRVQYVQYRTTCAGETGSRRSRI